MDTSIPLASNFKSRYGAFKNPLPEENSMAEFAKFCPAEERPGKQLEFPIKVTHEHGITFDNTDSAFVINPAIDAIWKTAIIDGSNILGTANIAYPQMARGGNGASKSGQSGGAYWKPIDAKVEALMVSAELYREVQLMFGPGSASTALADIGVNGAAVLSGANLNAGQTIRISTATWIAGLWPQMINGQVDIYSSDGATLVEAGVTVTSCDPTKCQLVLTKSGSTAGLSSGDKLYQAGSHHRSCIGLQPILENATTIFNIPANTYPMWRAVSFPIGGTLTRAKIGQFASRLFANGHKGGGKLFGGGACFADLAEEASALQRYTENTDKVKRQGADNILYVTAVGEINVTLHRYMKQGNAFFIAKNVMKRVGSTDLTFDLDGTNKWFYQEMPYNAGCSIRIFSNQAPILESPWHCGILTGIASNADVASAA
jgi:hypothetical protein